MNTNLIEFTEQKAMTNKAKVPLDPNALQNYLHAATADNTRKAYQADVRDFMNWGGLLPCDTSTLLSYLHAQAERLNARTLARRITAIKHWHIYQGFPDPTEHALVQKTLKGIQNTHGKPKCPAPALTLLQLRQMVEYLKEKNDLASIRNNALLQLDYFGAFRRSELVAIQWEHIVFSKEGIEILIPKSKTDQCGEGQTCAIPYVDNTLCAVKALEYWQIESGLQTGPLFRRLGKSQTIQSQAIAPRHVNFVLKQVAEAIGLSNANEFSSHSLRRGFATEASRKGAPFGAIKRQGRWQSDRTVLGYIEVGRRFEENAVDTILKPS